jgi:hypothetical protein
MTVSTPYLLSVSDACVQNQPSHEGVGTVLILNTEVEESVFELVPISTYGKGRALEFGTAMAVTVTVTVIMAMLSWQRAGKLRTAAPRTRSLHLADYRGANIADSAALHTFYAYHCAIMLLVWLGQYRNTYIGPEI